MGSFSPLGPTILLKRAAPSTYLPKTSTHSVVVEEQMNRHQDTVDGINNLLLLCAFGLCFCGLRLVAEHGSGGFICV